MVLLWSGWDLQYLNSQRDFILVFTMWVILSDYQIVSTILLAWQTLWGWENVSLEKGVLVRKGVEFCTETNSQ